MHAYRVSVCFELKVLRLSPNSESLAISIGPLASFKDVIPEVLGDLHGLADSSGIFQLLRAFLMVSLNTM